MRLAPRLNSGGRGRSPVVVAILPLGQPLGLAGALAGRPTGGLPAVALVAGIARVGREALPAARTGPPSFLPHVASPARSPIWLEDTPGRTPKKTPSGKKTPGRYRSEEEEDGQEGPVSPRPIYASFRSAATPRRLVDAGQRRGHARVANHSGQRAVVGVLARGLEASGVTAPMTTSVRIAPDRVPTESRWFGVRGNPQAEASRSTATADRAGPPLVLSPMDASAIAKLAERLSVYVADEGHRGRHGRGLALQTKA